MKKMELHFSSINFGVAIESIRLKVSREFKEVLKGSISFPSMKNGWEHPLKRGTCFSTTCSPFRSYMQMKITRLHCWNYQKYYRNVLLTFSQKELSFSFTVLIIFSLNLIFISSTCWILKASLSIPIVG